MNDVSSVECQMLEIEKMDLPLAIKRMFTKVYRLKSKDRDLRIGLCANSYLGGGGWKVFDVYAQNADDKEYGYFNDFEKALSKAIEVLEGGKN